MKWSSPRLLLGSALVILCILLIGGTIFLVSYLGRSKPTLIPTNTLDHGIPAPSSARTTYSNTKYGYTFVYPTDWILKEFEFQGVDRITATFPVAVGDMYPFELGCMSNPNGLDAQSWWKQNGSGIPIGLSLLKSGETAFLSVGRGQRGYTEYTLVHNHAACLFSANQADQAITEINISVINSFKWK